MKRRSFIKKTALATAGTITAPYLLPSGRLFAASGSRIADHVIFVLFAGGLRQQESVEQRYVSTQEGYTAEGNVMSRMLNGTPPTSPLYPDWGGIGGQGILQDEGTLFKEMRYAEGYTGHFNAHAVAMTGSYISTGLNQFTNPTAPTVFEYYRKHSDPAKNAVNAWWLSEGLSAYPALNYSSHPDYGPGYGANYLNPMTLFGNEGQIFNTIADYHPDELDKVHSIKHFLDDSFGKSPDQLPGVRNSEADREHIRQFLIDLREQRDNGQLEYPTPSGNAAELSFSAGGQKFSSDLVNIAYAWEVFKEFTPELTVINTFNVDDCHFNFPAYLHYLHREDYAMAWLWNKVKTETNVGDNTIMICVPEHGRNIDFNNEIVNGMRAIDHTNDDNSRRVFGMMVGNGVKQQVLNENDYPLSGKPLPETVDVVPTIGHILGFEPQMSYGSLSGRVLEEAF